MNLLILQFFLQVTFERDPTLDQWAAERAEQICENFSHDGFLDSVAELELPSAKWTVGENLSRKFKTERGLASAWWASETHRKNLEDSRYKYMGLGQADCGTVVQTFSSLKPQSLKGLLGGLNLI